MSNSTALTLTLPSVPTLVPGQSLEAYIASVNRVPVLTEAQEQALAQRFRRDNDLEAARQLVLSHLRFVVKVARGYGGYGLPLADLVSEGTVGLMKAVKRFDPSVGVRLVSFAVHWIKAEMHEYIIRNWRIVKVATTKAQRKLFFNLRSMKQRLGWSSADEVADVARALKVSEADVREMEARLNARDAAFDVLPENDDDYSAPVNTLADHQLEPSRLISEAEQETQQSKHLQHALAGLDARARDIIAKRYLAEDAAKSTLHELADVYQISAERVRQIENAALKKLKTALLAS